MRQLWIRWEWEEGCGGDAEEINEHPVPALQGKRLDFVERGAEMTDARFEELLTAFDHATVRRYAKWTEENDAAYFTTWTAVLSHVSALQAERDALQAERDAANDAYYMECRLRESTTAERDAARRELCEKSAELKMRDAAGLIAWRGRDEADVRGWSYLYEKEVTK